MRSAVIRLNNKLEKSNIVDIIEFDQELYDAGWQLFEERADKDWGIIDCISFIVMQENKISEALAADKHFEQAGFTKLL
jgi:predicted nucleic acid-binding protein